MYTNRLPLFVFLLVVSVCCAQENDFIRGKVLDSSTGEPVVFATVRIIGKTKGVITNMDGSFRLPMSFRIAGEAVEISSMGFKRKEYELIKLSTSGINILYLQPGVFGLSEAIVKAKKKRRLRAGQIVRRAVKNIPINYPNHNFSTIGYYRDYQLDSIGYTNLNEAVLEIFDQGFKDSDTTTTKILIYDYLRNKRFRRDTVSDNPYNYRRWDKVIDNAYISDYGGNELSILRVHDPIRNFQLNSFDFINNLWEGDLIRNHSFERVVDTYVDNNLLYAINIKKRYPGYSALGKIYIEASNYAIHKLEYTVYDDRKRNKDSSLQKLGIKGTVLFQVVTEYKKDFNGLMYPNFISLSNTFQIRKPPKFFIEDVLVSGSDAAFIITFNNTLSIDNNVEDLNHYSFWFDNKKISLNKAEKIDECTIWVYPNISIRDIYAMTDKLVVMNRKRLSLDSIFKTEIIGLKDESGNFINVPEKENYLQFREYFVQETKPYGSFKAIDSLGLMDMNRPIFDNQPINRLVNFNNYWMNTPLPNIQN